MSCFPLLNLLLLVQKEYFGKKGISVHVDVFFTKSDAQLQKSVYFTVLFRCDQDVIDTLSVTDVVLKQYHEDFPSMINIYAKSDKVGCYTGNGYVETEYNICKSHGITLVRIIIMNPKKVKIRLIGRVLWQNIIFKHT